MGDPLILRLHTPPDANTNRLLFMTAESQRAYRDRLRGGPPRQPAPHGTAAAIRRHERNRQPLCESCRLERNRLAREYYLKRRQ